AGPVRRTLAGLVRCTLGSKTATRHHAIACANRATVRADDTSDSDILCRRREVGARLRHERGWRAMAYCPFDGALGGVLATVPDGRLEAIVVLADVFVQLADDRAEHLDGRLPEDAYAFGVGLERLVEVGQAEAVAGPVLLQDSPLRQALVQ